LTRTKTTTNLARSLNITNKIKLELPDDNNISSSLISNKHISKRIKTTRKIIPSDEKKATMFNKSNNNDNNIINTNNSIKIVKSSILIRSNTFYV